MGVESKHNVIKPSSNKKKNDDYKHCTTKRKRKNFSASEKMHVLQTVDACEYGEQKHVLCKLGVSTTSLHEFRKARGSIALLAEKDGTVVRASNHGIKRVKDVITEMIINNSNRLPCNQVKLTWKFIHDRAMMTRSHLLEKDAEEQYLSNKERDALLAFKASKKWCLKIKKDVNITKVPRPRLRQHDTTITINGQRCPCSQLHYDPNESSDLTEFAGGTMMVDNEIVHPTMHEPQGC